MVGSLPQGRGVLAIPLGMFFMENSGSGVGGSSPNRGFHFMASCGTCNKHSRSFCMEYCTQGIKIKTILIENIWETRPVLFENRLYPMW